MTIIIIIIILIIIIIIIQISKHISYYLTVNKKTHPNGCLAAFSFSLLLFSFTLFFETFVSMELTLPAFPSPVCGAIIT